VLEVLAIAMIDLDDFIRGSQIRFYQGIPGAISGDFMSHVQQLFLQAHVVVPEAGGCYVLQSPFFYQGLLVGSELTTRPGVSK
jgi:hypothetical protein